MEIDEHDDLGIRCPKLGGPVPFKYCRQMAEGLPCHYLIGCWQGRFDVVSFLTESYTQDELRACFSPSSKGRIARIFEVLEKAKGESQNPDGSENLS